MKNDCLAMFGQKKSFPSNSGTSFRACVNSYSDILEKVSPTVVNIYLEVQNQSPLFFHQRHVSLLANFSILFASITFDFCIFDRAHNPSLALGSGFFVNSKGLICTNFHVIENARDSNSIFVMLHDEQIFPAKVVKFDQLNDLALLQIDSSSIDESANFPFLELEDCGNCRVGDVVLAIGNSFGL